MKRGGVLGGLSFLAACLTVWAVPAKGAVYRGFEVESFDESGEPELQVDLATTVRLARDGRHLAARPGGSWVWLRLRCDEDLIPDMAVTARLPGGRAGVGVRPTGEFRHAGTVRGVRFRIVGRVLTRDAVRLTYRAVRPGSPTAEPYPQVTCRSGLTRMVAYRNGVEPWRDGCSPTGPRILARSDHTVAFARYRYAPWSGPWFFADLYGCLLGGEPIRLSRASDSFVWDDPVLAGPYVAYSRAYCVDGCFPFRVHLRDLRDGSRLPVGYPSASTPANDRVAAAITDLVLKENASLAWIEWGMSPPGGARLGPLYRVIAQDSHGVRLLAEAPGSNVNRTSLELNGSALTWGLGDITGSTTLD